MISEPAWWGAGSWKRMTQMHFFLDSNSRIGMNYTTRVEFGFLELLCGVHGISKECRICIFSVFWSSNNFMNLKGSFVIIIIIIIIKARLQPWLGSFKLYTQEHQHWKHSIVLQNESGTWNAECIVRNLKVSTGFHRSYYRSFIMDMLKC